MQSSPDKSQSLIRFVKYNLWGFLWGLLIILLTVLPGKVFPRLPSFMDLFQPDKLVHLTVFAVFFFLLVRGFLLQDLYPLLQQRAILVSFIIGISLGMATEIIQELYVPMRYGDIYDFLADAAGCMAGWGFFHTWRKKFYDKT